MTTSRQPRVLCVINSHSSGPKRLTAWLEETGIEVVLMPGEDGLPANLTGFDGLVLLGGGLMPDAYERAPWLHAERQLAGDAIEADLPTLGICLGAQIIADVAGGEVREKFGPKERGSTLIHLNDAGKGDAVLHTLGGTAPMIEHHEDMITRLPDAAVLLASSDAIETQAFVIGSHVRGVQFHPEAGAATIENWDEAELRAEGLDRAKLRAAAEAVDDENMAASRRLIDAFAAEVHESAAHTPSEQ